MHKKIDPEKFFSSRPDPTKPNSARPECDVCRYSEICHKRVAEWNAAVEKYPNACDKCNGTGMLEFTENGAPHGEGYWPMLMTEPCCCIEDDRCPRCATEIQWEGEHGEVATCSGCGTKFDLDNWQDLQPVIPGEKPYCMYLESVYDEFADLYGEQL